MQEKRNQLFISSPSRGFWPQTEPWVGPGAGDVLGTVGQGGGTSLGTLLAPEGTAPRPQRCPVPSQGSWMSDLELLIKLGFYRYNL